jgi:GNAT superfamily N-acetyltransferase
MESSTDGISIVELAHHAHHRPLVLRWRAEAFPHVDPSAPSHDPLRRVLCPARPEGPPRTLLAFEAGVPIGFVTWILFARRGEAADDWVDALYVEPEQRGRAVASRLLAAIERVARERGVTQLRAYTDRLALYRRAGWVDEVPGLSPTPALRVLRRSLHP